MGVSGYVGIGELGLLHVVDHDVGRVAPSTAIDVVAQFAAMDGH